MPGFRDVLQKAQLDAARASAAQLTSALRDASAAADSLNKRGPMTPQQAATAEVKRLASEAREAESAFKALAAAQARSEAAGARTSARVAAQGAKTQAHSEAKATAARAQSIRKQIEHDQRAAKEATETTKGGKDGSGGNGAPKGIKYLLKHAGVGKAAMGAAGAAGALELTSLALGQRGMMQLSALTTRAGMQVRSLFKGVDPSPIVRAADRFFQLFNPMTAAGKGLSQLFGNVFNGFFGAVEKAQPYVSAFVKGMIIGAQNVEIAWLQLRIAMLPVTAAIEDALGPIGDIESVADVGAVALVALGVAAAVAAAPIVAIGAAVTAVSKAFEQLSKLRKEVAAAGGVSGALHDISQHFEGHDSEEEIWKRSQANYAAQQSSRIPTKAPDVPANDVGAAGVTTGQHYAAGLAKGAASGAGDVNAAGQALAVTLDQGTRKAGKIQSPSKLAEGTGAQFPAGTVRGVESGAGDVQDAAERSMVPKMPGSPSGSSSGPSGAGAMVFPPEALALLREIAANTRRGGSSASRAAGDIMRDIALDLGVSVGPGAA